MLLQLELGAVGREKGSFRKGFHTLEKTSKTLQACLAVLKLRLLFASSMAVLRSCRGIFPDSSICHSSASCKEIEFYLLSFVFVLLITTGTRFLETNILYYFFFLELVSPWLAGYRISP